MPAGRPFAWDHIRARQKDARLVCGHFEWLYKAVVDSEMNGDSIAWRGWSAEMVGKIFRTRRIVLFRRWQLCVGDSPLVTTASPGRKGVEFLISDLINLFWRPRRDLNPCYRRERTPEHVTH
jgi:hypothetical protein